LFLPEPRVDVPQTLTEVRTRALAAPPKSLNSMQEALLQSITLQQAELRAPSQRTARRALARGTGTPTQRYDEAKSAFDALDRHYRDLASQRTLRVLFVHGVGHGDQDTAWRDRWRETIATAIAAQPNGSQWIVESEFAAYDDIFDQYPLGPKETISALLRMTGGLIEGTPGGAKRGLFDALTSIDDKLRWTAGMVIQWVDIPALRDALCKRVGDHIARFEPDLIAAHSLGTLISYDLLRRDIAANQGARHRGQVLFTFGSQIAHPAVLPVFDGRIEPLHDANGDGLAHWFHLYNARDRVFTRPLPLADATTTNLLSDFDCPGDILNHDGACYLARQEAEPVWQFETAATRAIARRDAGTPAATSQSTAVPAIARTRRSPRRALLVGINAYPDPANRLEGCVNDTFLMSSVLQEFGFDPRDIRLLLDERATREAMVQRMEWLVDGMQAGDLRILFYSGHGAQIPSYGPHAEPDGLDETLVPYDFDWSAHTAFTDKEFHQFYSQLPYASHLLGIFDCCHAGGMTRGGALRVRGIDPPDDVRHRALRWSADDQMWVPRDWVPQGPRPNRLFTQRSLKADDSSCRFLGQATLSRSKASGQKRSQNRTRKLYDHKGPYMPLLMYACGEKELASEYEHGSVSYGAFTFVLARTLREMKQGDGRSSLEAAVKDTRTELVRLGYSQTPEMIGSSAKYTARVNLVDLVRSPSRDAPARKAPPRKRAKRR
jgi:metacaspase-1